MEKHGLAKTLDQLVKDAAAHPGQPRRQPLARGLRVDVMLLDGDTYLQISRANTWPSSREWTTIARDWPQPVPNILAKRVYNQGRYYLKATWRTIDADQPELINGDESPGDASHGDGQGLVEYALLLALVTITVIVILALLGSGIGNAFSNMYVNL